ncbi:MAG: YegS/Rv2252/BmrU family lipid kinase [Nocardioidaceae bacterium]
MTFSAVARRRLWVWSAFCLLVVVALALMVRFDAGVLDRFDHRLGTPPYDASLAHPGLVHFWYGVEVAFSAWPEVAATALVAGLLVWRKHPRAAVWTVAVMIGASLTTTLLKLSFTRARPTWQDPLRAPLTSYSFPSGHASGIASAMGVAIVLTFLLVRRRGLRRWLTVLFLGLVLLVGLDRIFLGVHNPSDVLAGYAVGGFWVLAGAAVYDPSPRPKRRQSFVSPVPQTKQLAVVLNPIKVEDVAAFREMVERRAREAGWGVPTWHTTTAEDPGRSMAEAAAVDGAELVIVCGGDGTVRTVCAELAGTGVSVGVVPAGTGNLLARNLGIPLYLQAAVDVALNGQDRAIDLGEISGDGIPEDEHFMVMAGMGFDAAIMEGANEQIKAKVGWLAYVVSALRNLMFPAIRVEISVDDGPWTRHRVRTVVIGNVGYLQAGIPLLPDAAIDDGVLDVVLISPRRFLSWVPLAVRIFSRNKRVDDTLNRMTGRKVSVRAQHDTPRQLDGDAIGAGRALPAACVHGRLLMRVPR